MAVARRSPRPAAAPAPPTLRDALASAGHDVHAWTADRRRRRTLFVHLTDAEVDALAAGEPLRVQRTIASADRIVRHEFDLLGSGLFRPVDPARATQSPVFSPQSPGSSPQLPGSSPQPSVPSPQAPAPVYVPIDWSV